MPTITCENCGTEFDTDREGGHAAADTSRCPSCGQKNPVPATDGGAGEATTLRVPEGAVVRITIEVLPGGD